MKISIITATKNNKSGLLRAIEYVRNQTYKNVEHIIVDGGSTDGTVEILKQVQDDIRSAQYDSRLTTNYSLLTISEADSGIYDAINKGIKLATGDVIGLLHSDDLYADENVLERYAEIFKRPFDFAQGDNVDAVYSDLVYVRKKREVRDKKLEDKNSVTTNYLLPTTDSLLNTNYSVIRYWKTHKSLISNQSSVNSSDTDHHLLVTDHLLKKGWMPPHPTLFIRKELFTKYGFYRTDMKIAADYEMILRLLYKHKN
ncbi:MAG: glycosyltransferase [Ignavibacteriaceae bacterium]|nr:glycosyltransferase [Ignavibacteriaceae bacterium]